MSGIHSKVFLEIQIGSNSPQLMTFELYSNTPKTSENFRALCTGEKGKNIDRKPLWFKNSIFHRVIDGFMAQGGDITQSNGTGGESIYTEPFEDENFSNKHIGPGCLAMANSGPDSNTSQFYITFDSFPHLDGKHVVFGKITSGMEVLMDVAGLGQIDGKPRKKVKVVNCGETSQLKR
jgi:cyclophilin family peptidyl-prolyl cis-trans isomerase